MNTALVPLFALTVLSAGAAVIDARTRRIPNRLIVVGLAGGALLNLATHLVNSGASPGGALALGALSLSLGIVVCGLVPLALFRMGAMGGGDVKLLAVAGACAGPLVGMQIQLAAFVLGAAFAIVQLGFTGQLARMLDNALRLVQNPFRPPARRRPISGALLTSLPFGPAIFAATLLVTVAKGWIR